MRLIRVWPGLSLAAATGVFALTEFLAVKAGIQPAYTVLGGIYMFVGTLAIAKSVQSLLESLSASQAAPQPPGPELARIIGAPPVAHRAPRDGAADRAAVAGAAARDGDEQRSAKVRG
jgi:hypothetical protein